MLIKNVQVFTENNYFKPGEIAIDKGLLTDVANVTDDIVLDGEGCYALPGFIDIHFHGCMGYDFCDGTLESIAAIAKYQAEHGVTAIAPATMTLSEEDLLQIMDTAATYNNVTCDNAPTATLVGINMEGPFINTHKKGAQSATHIRSCDVDLFRRLQTAAKGLIKLVDIAPEEDGAMEFIEALKSEVTISLAHTAADYDTAMFAYAKGARHATHLYNAMPAFSHREPGVIGAAKDSNHCMVELICDGIHIHPCVVRSTFDLFGKDRIVMISDSMCATGMSDGQYLLGGQAVQVIGNRATLVEGGNLAGSATNLLDCMRTAVRQMGIPLELAIPCCTINPAKAIGIDHNYGSLSFGKVANIILLDKDLNLKTVIINGKTL